MDSDSNEYPTNPFVPNDKLENPEEIVRTITAKSATEPNGVLQRLETFTQMLSKHTTRDNASSMEPDDFDLKEILHTFVRESAEQGIHIRKSGVSFKNVSAFGIDESTSFIPTVGDVFKSPYYLVKSLTHREKTAERVIIQKVNGLARSGEMVLVLGRPGAGCSTFLKTMAGETQEYTNFEGDILYDGIDQKEMMANYKSDIIYNPELDVHFPHLTVDQTLRFAIACKTPETRVNGVTREEYITAQRDILATVFGLTHTYHTKVGNDFVRGVSGGERKRVSIAEAMAARGSIYCWDNATRGLDASTALEYAQAIRVSTNLLKSTAFVTIYQAGENIYECFDKVTVLYLGRQVYFGPVLEAKKYFENMGFECPQRQSTAEFLTAVTDPHGRKARPGYENRVPRNADEFEDYWLNSTEYADLIKEIETYNSDVSKEVTHNLYHESMRQDKMKSQRIKSRYTITVAQQLKLLTIRGFQRIWGDKAFTITQVVGSIVQSLLNGSMYYNTPDGVNGAFSRTGIVFNGLLYFTLMAVAEMAETFSTRPILRKQAGYSFYHPGAEALAATFTDIPIKFFSASVFILIYYFLSNLERQAGKFFLFFLFLMISTISSSALFKSIASFNKSPATAGAISGICLLFTLLYASYMIQRPYMHPWFKWISYLNPFAYAFEGIVSSEFHGRAMECGEYLVPSGTGYENVSVANQVCSFKGSEIGEAIVSGDRYMKVAYDYSYDNIWRNLGIVIAFAVFFIFLFSMGTEFVNPMVTGGDKLMFLRGKLPENILLPKSKKEKDVESSEKNHSSELTDSPKKENVFTDLKTKDYFMWRDVKYVIPYDGSERTLLDNISGYCKPGTLTALMGESGAGKTTLLNTLAQRIHMGVVTGDMLVNGSSLDKSFSRRTGYVQQQDLHISELTVRESLIFAARLRRPVSVPDEEKLEYVEKIISVLQMEAYSDAIIGDPGFGLNVEQRKKLSIGVELVAKPSLLLFLDEPTSGLDSQSAWAIIQLLRDLANAGQSILCTIHQPSATLFEEFDRLLLLKKGGQTVYFGDIGERSRTLLDYFENNGARHCDDHENPAEYILEAIGAGATASVSEDWYQKWVDSKEYIESMSELDKLVEETKSINPNSTDASLNDTFATPYSFQLRYVTLRTFQQFWRSQDYFVGRLVLNISAGLVVGFSFWNLDHSITGMQSGLFVGFLSVILSVPLINMIQERAIASRELFEVREAMSNTYHWSTLLIAQLINEVPYLIGTCTLYFFCCYFPTKVSTDASHAGIFFLTYCIMFSLYYGSYALFVVYIAPDLASANVLVGVSFAFIIGFSGVVQPVHLMPGFWTFMNKVSPYTYYVGNLVSSVLEGREVVCSKEELAYFIPEAGKTCGEFAGAFTSSVGGQLIDPNNSTLCGYCTYKETTDYMSSVNIRYSDIWRNFGFFWVYIIFNISSMLILYYFLRVRKSSKKSK